MRSEVFVLIFGGKYLSRRYLSDNFAPNNENIELTGESIDTLKWNVISEDEVKISISFLAPLSTYVYELKLNSTGGPPVT